MPKRQLKSILSRPTDLFICHQEAGLLFGKELLKLNYKVAFDFEDWYSEDYITRERPLKLLRKAELKAIRNCAYVTCPSYSMAAVLDQKFNANKQIQVIYNTFQNSEESSCEHYKIKNSIVWFSQTIGPDRGLESFLKSVRNFILPLEIHLVGACTSTFKNYLEELVESSRHVLVIHPLMKHSRLMKFLKKFKIGLALENNFPQNKNLTISNKILTYLQLNLHVIATATSGQLELSEDFKSKITYVDLADPLQTHDKIKMVLINVDLVSTAFFPYKYSWNAQKGKILDLVRESVLD